MKSKAIIHPPMPFQKLFVKGNLYYHTTLGIVVLCTKTTNPFVDEFEGVVVHQPDSTNDYQNGHTSKTWNNKFEPFHGEIVLSED